MRRHTHIEDWWRWSGTVWSASRTRVVLAAAPGEADTRVANWIALHLIDGHFCCMTLDELNEAAALSWWNLDIGDLAKALEEGTQLVFGNVAGKTTHEDSGIVGVSELVHWHTARASSITAREEAAHLWWWSISWHTTWLHSWWMHVATWTALCSTAALVLWRGRGDAHRTVAAVDTLHFSEGALLLAFIGEADETIATRHAADWVGHDLCRLARRELVLEKGVQDVFVDLWAKIADEDRVLGSALITAADVVSHVICRI